jgi:hypothetical protein
MKTKFLVLFLGAIILLANNSNAQNSENKSATVTKSNPVETEDEKAASALVETLLKMKNISAYLVNSHSSALPADQIKTKLSTFNDIFNNPNLSLAAKSKNQKIIGYYKDYFKHKSALDKIVISINSNGGKINANESKSLKTMETNCDKEINKIGTFLGTEKVDSIKENLILEY